MQTDTELHRVNSMKEQCDHSTCSCSDRRAGYRHACIQKSVDWIYLNKLLRPQDEWMEVCEMKAALKMLFVQVRWLKPLDEFVDAESAAATLH